MEAKSLQGFRKGLAYSQQIQPTGSITCKEPTCKLLPLGDLQRKDPYVSHIFSSPFIWVKTSAAPTLLLYLTVPVWGEGVVWFAKEVT